MEDSNDEVSETAFKHTWNIKNWLNVIQNESLILNTKTEMKCKVDNTEYASFSIGFSLAPGKPYNCLRIHWTLLKKHYNLPKVDAHLVAEFVQRNGITGITVKSEASAMVGKTIDTRTDTFGFPYKWLPLDVACWLNPEGSLVVKLEITIKNLAAVFQYSKEEEFRKSCEDEFSYDMAYIMEDTESSDVKIITKDETEFHAHKCILRARCGSDFLESSTGQVNVDDISAKTMEILLKFWYSGKLEPSWKEKDIVAEFTHAAGKYRIVNVLKMLDEFLGNDFRASDGNVELLKIVQNLSLKSAEARILKHLVHKIGKTSSGKELLELVSLGTKGLDKVNSAALEILKEFDDIMSEEHGKDASARHVKLLQWACELGIKNVEQKLLQRIFGTVNKITNANELFALFEIDK